MEILDILLKRRSIRKYTAERIPEEKLEKILQAGLLSPTSRNLKEWEFYVVEDRAVLNALSAAKERGAGMVADCAAAIVVFGDSSRADTWVEDCSIAMTGMMITAESEGIGCCWSQIHFRKDADGKDAEENVRRILSVPDTYRTVGILSMGIPAEDPAPHTLEELDWTKVKRL